VEEQDPGEKGLFEAMDKEIHPISSKKIIDIFPWINAFIKGSKNMEKHDDEKCEEKEI